MSSFCICKSYSHFFSKNTCELDIVLTTTVKILTTKELVKLSIYLSILQHPLARIMCRVDCDLKSDARTEKEKVKGDSVKRTSAEFIFFWFGFYGPFKNISLISSRSFIEGGRKPENAEKNHLTIRKQNLAFPHMTRARLEPQRWET